MSLCGRKESRLRVEGLAVFFMQFLDLEDVAAGLDYVEVEFIPPSQGCEFWARDV